MLEDYLIQAKEYYHFLIPGVSLALTTLFLILKFLFPKTPNKALRIFVGAGHITFKAKPFEERRLWRDSVTRKCEHIKVEVYSVKYEKMTFYNLTDRKTLVKANIELEEPLQIRFKYKDGFFWTAWSQKIKKTIQRPPFQLKIYKDKKDSHQQPENSPEPREAEEIFYNNFCQDFKNRISNSNAVNIRLMGRIGTGKSSLINTLSYAFTTVWGVKAAAYGQNGSVTKGVTKYEIVPGKVNLVDMPGWQNDSGFQIMGEIINGVYDGMQPDMQQSDQRQKAHQTPGLNEGPKSDEKNSIIFVVAAEDAEEEDNVNKKIIKELIDLGYPCLAVVTKVDRLSEKGEESINADNFYTDPRVVDCCNQLRSLGINYILPIINYTHQAPQNSKINYVALHALDEAIRLAR